MPKVSVVVPVYNVCLYIERCARSLFEQTIDSIEYIFVNDCTQDESIDILKRVIEDYPNRKDQIQIIENRKNRGLWYSRKVGMKLATGDYVIVCDSDDWLDLNAYELMYEQAEEKNADIICCGIYVEKINQTKIILYPYKEENRETIKNTKYVEGWIFSAFWNKLIKRNLYMGNNIYNYDNINMWEDLGVTLRLRFLSCKTLVLNKALYHYNRFNESSITAIPKLSNVEDQICCALYLEQFFKSMNDEDQFSMIIKYLKFKSKINLLVAKNIRNVDRWMNLYPELNGDIFQYKGVLFYNRLACWCVSHGLSKLGLFILDCKYFFLKYKR